MTPIGDIGVSMLETNTNRNVPFGPYEGYTWYYERGSNEPAEITIVKLDIWRRESGKIFWRFKYDPEKKNSHLLQDYEIWFQYSLSADKSLEPKLRQR